MQAQKELINDRMNIHKIENVKKLNEELIKWHELKKHVLIQRAKIDWLKFGDGKNSYFHASIKAKQKYKSMRMLWTTKQGLEGRGIQNLKINSWWNGKPSTMDTLLFRILDYNYHTTITFQNPNGKIRNWRTTMKISKKSIKL